MEIDEVYGKAIKQLYEASEDCKKLAELIEEKIPETACEKSRLQAIVLGNNISSLDELTRMLEGRIEYLESSDIDTRQELSRFHDMYKALEKYGIMENVDKRPKILDFLQGKAPTDYSPERG